MANNPYKDILNMVKATDKAQTMGEQFVDSINRYFQLSKETYVPSKTIKPSSLGSCMRLQYAILIGAQIDPGKLENASMATIQKSGNDCHNRIQFACQDAVNYRLPIVWLDPEVEVKKANSIGINTQIKRKDGNELLCYNSDYHLNFKCDGIITFKDIRMILEIKSETEQKYNTHFSVRPEHEYQAVAYSIALGIDHVMFLYENRNTTQRKGFYIEITEEKKQEVKDKIARLLEYYKNETIPPKDTTKCVYCNYKQWCKKVGDGIEKKIKF